jgi:hypothetical protein
MVRPGRDRISGCVQVDETYVGGPKNGGKRGRGAAGIVTPQYMGATGVNSIPPKSNCVDYVLKIHRIHGKFNSANLTLFGNLGWVLKLIGLMKK